MPALRMEMATFDCIDPAVLARLTAAGAVEVGRHAIGEDFRWVVLTDPEGNAFCVGTD